MNITIGEQVFVGVTGYLKINWVQFDIVIKLKKILYVQPISTHLVYENLWNGLLNIVCGGQGGSLPVHV